MFSDETEKMIVTGAAGFVGSSLVDSLLAQGHKVIGIDDLRTGNLENLRHAKSNRNFQLLQMDLLDELPSSVLKDCSRIYHFAANADVRFGPTHPKRDIEQNTLITHKILEQARTYNIKKFLFASTGSVYGEASEFPTKENSKFPIQTSLYAASKNSAESFITAYSFAFNIQVYILRFVSILGPRYSHGHIIDFYKSLLSDPSRLKVLGNGLQKKSYIHVEDCITAINKVVDKTIEQVGIYNVGTEEFVTVKESISWICEELGVTPRLEFEIGDRGWVGDNPFIYLDTRKIRDLGWEPKWTIEASVRNTILFLRNQKR